jgi:hypothetical protein
MQKNEISRDKDLQGSEADARVAAAAAAYEDARAERHFESWKRRNAAQSDSNA